MADALQGEQEEAVCPLPRVHVARPGTEPAGATVRPGSRPLHANQPPWLRRLCSARVPLPGTAAPWYTGPRRAARAPRERRQRIGSPAQSIVGWREWVVLPDLGGARVKAKIDTGARTSALHAFSIEHFRRRGRDMVRFQVHPVQRQRTPSIEVEAPLLEMRRVRSSSGHATPRPVIRTPVELMGQRWEVELTLASRDAMGFRMLLGRQAIRGRFLVDTARSFVGGRHAKKRKKKRRKKS